MRDELLPYYERELAFIRQMASEFAEKYPKVADRLLLGPDTCEDPHVERLIEAFALLCGRVHHKLDDEFPEITEALLDTLYPHYLRPVPPLGIAQFQLDPSQSAAGLHRGAVRHGGSQQSRQRSILFFSDLLSRRDLASQSHRRVCVDREPVRIAGSGRRCSRRDSYSNRVHRRNAVRAVADRFPPLLSERRKRRRTYALRVFIP